MSEDILGAIDAAIDDYEIGPDAVRFNAPADVVAQAEQPELVASHSHVWVRTVGTDEPWRHVGTVPSTHPLPGTHRPDALRDVIGAAALRQVILVPDFGPLMTQAFADIGRAASRAMDSFARWLRRMLGLDREPEDPRLQYGHNLDPVTNWWQSDMCAAWLHESCPLPDQCDCTRCARKGHPR